MLKLVGTLIVSKLEITKLLFLVINMSIEELSKHFDRITSDNNKSEFENMLQKYKMGLIK